MTQSIGLLEEATVENWDRFVITFVNYSDLKFEGVTQVGKPPLFACKQENIISQILTAESQWAFVPCVYGTDRS